MLSQCMRLAMLVSVFVVLTLSPVYASQHQHLHRHRPGTPRFRLEDHIRASGDSSSAYAAIKTGTFEQYIDHSNPGLGTFQQRYWYNDEHYAGQGSPVVLFNAGEVAADDYLGYLYNQTLSGKFAEVVGGATILLEHRYWGGSSPFTSLTTETLQHHTVYNAIHDMTHFANTVQLPFDPSRSSSASNAPWVLSGCSYSGNLAAWTYAKQPGTFWAYHCSSAVVHNTEDFWEYAQVVEQAMPRNCSVDVKRVIDYVDSILLTGTDTDKHDLKKQFGSDGVPYDDDFAAMMANGPFAWQDVSFQSGYSSFYQFCDYIENRWPGSTSPQPGANGVGLQKALGGFIKWFQDVQLQGSCNDSSVVCFDTHDPESAMYTDTSVSNDGAFRQWLWILCNEPFENWQTRGPTNSSIVSRLIKPEYFQRQCALYFPPQGKFSYGIARGLTPSNINRWTGDWGIVNTTRLMWAVGELDPWRPLTMASASRPGGPLQSTKQAPVRVIPRASHCNDLSWTNALKNEGVMKVYNEQVQNMKEWVDEFYKTKGKKRPGYKG